MSLDYNPPPTLIMREYSQDDLMKEMASRENSLTRRGSCIDFYDPLPLPPPSPPSPKSKVRHRFWRWIFKKLF